MTDATRLAGKIVLVTGGGSGLGKGVCERVSAEGGMVAVVDIRRDLADSVAARINEEGGRAIAVGCDVADEEQVAAAVAETVKAFGALHGLFANAGTAGTGWIHETTLEDWHFVLGVNLTGPFLCAKHSLPHMMAAGGGSIVITSSVAGSVVGPGGAAASYTVSKHGVIGLAKHIAVDYASHNIRANAIQPAGIRDSNLAQHVREDRSRQSTPVADLPRGKPWMLVRRGGDPRDEYGATVAFLLSDEAGYITGTSIVIDGGLMAT